MTTIEALAIDGDPNRPLGAPAIPPNEWFTEIPDGWAPLEDLDDPLIYVDSSGRFAALVAPYNECILDAGRRRGECWTAPMSQTGYEYAYNGKQWPTLLADGTVEKVRIGNVCADIPHANGTEGSIARRAMFDDTSKIRARVRYYDRPDLGGIFALGAMTATATVWDALCMQAVGLSGEWWPVEGLRESELVGPIIVAEQGLRGGVRRRATRRAAVFAAVTSDDGVIQAAWVPADDELHEAGLFKEENVQRSDTGQFAKKEGGSTSTQARKKAVVIGAKKPKGGKGKKKKAGGKGGGKAKPTEEQKAAEAEKKKAESEALKEQKRVEAETAAEAKKFEQLGADSWEAALSSNDLKTALKDSPAAADAATVADELDVAAQLAGDPKFTDRALESLQKAFDAADRASSNLGGSDSVDEQAAAVKMQRLKADTAAMIRQLGGEDPISKVTATQRAKSVSDAKSKATETVRKQAERAVAKEQRAVESAKKKSERDKKAAERAADKAARDAAKTKKGASVTDVSEVVVAAADSAVPPETPSGAVLVALPASGQWTDNITDVHCTVVYIPGERAADGIDTLLAYAEEKAKELAPFVATTAGTGMIGAEGAAAVFLNSGDLAELNEECAENLDDLDGIEPTYPSFLAHVTTGYDAEPFPHDPTRTIAFDRLAVWNGDDRTEFALEGDEAHAPVDADPDNEPMEAAVATECSCKKSNQADTAGEEAVVAEEPTVAAAAEIPEVDADALDAEPAEAAAPGPDMADIPDRVATLEDAVDRLLAAEAARQAKEVPELDAAVAQ